MRPSPKPCIRVLSIFAPCLALFAWTGIAVEFRSEDKLRAAVKREPTNARAHLDLVDWHTSWNESDKAIIALEHALAVDSKRAWRYHERLGDIQYELKKDLNAAAASYKAALQGKPRARHSLLRYVELLIWNNSREEAEKLLEGSIAAGLVRHKNQRPLELLQNVPDHLEAWVEPLSYDVLENAVGKLKDLVGAAKKEFTKWSTSRPQDGEVCKALAVDPTSRGRRLQFGVHQPRFERGVWRDRCSYKAPATCKTLKAINATGLAVLRSSFDVLEPGVIVRPHCHVTNGELFIDVALSVPQGQGALTTTVGSEVHAWSVGEVRILDGSFEHAEANTADVGRESGVLLRVVVRHPQLPCVGGYSECGLVGLWRQLSSRIFGSASPGHEDGFSEAPDEL